MVQTIYKTPEELLNHMVSAYGNQILRMCTIYLKDVHLAEDATQETFIKILHGYEHFQGKSSEKTWVLRIAINECKNQLRSRWFKRLPETEDFYRMKDETSVLDQLQLSSDMLREVMKLPVKYREVILLYYYQDLKTDEIAELLRIPSSTVSARLKRARERLKPTLKECVYDG